MSIYHAVSRNGKRFFSRGETSCQLVIAFLHAVYTWFRLFVLANRLARVVYPRLRIWNNKLSFFHLRPEDRRNVHDRRFSGLKKEQGSSSWNLFWIFGFTRGTSFHLRCSERRLCWRSPSVRWRTSRRVEPGGGGKETWRSLAKETLSSTYSMTKIIVPNVFSEARNDSTRCKPNYGIR